MAYYHCCVILQGVPEALFRHLDPDNDGEITYSEFTKAFIDLDLTQLCNLDIPVSPATSAQNAFFLSHPFRSTTPCVLIGHVFPIYSFSPPRRTNSASAAHRSRLLARRKQCNCFGMKWQSEDPCVVSSSRSTAIGVNGSRPKVRDGSLHAFTRIADG